MNGLVAQEEEENPQVCTTFRQGSMNGQTNRETKRNTQSPSFRESWSCSFSTDSLAEGEEERNSSSVGLRRKRNSSRTVLYPETTIQSTQDKHSALLNEGNFGVDAVTKKLASETFEFASSDTSRRKKTVFGNAESFERNENLQKHPYSCSPPSGSLPSECVESSVFYSTQSSNGHGYSQTTRVITDSSEYIGDSEDSNFQNISLPKVPRRAMLMSGDGGVPPKRRREIVSRLAKNTSEGPTTIATTKSYRTRSWNLVNKNSSYDSSSKETVSCPQDATTWVLEAERVHSEVQEGISITACFPASSQTENTYCTHPVEELSSTPSEEQTFQQSLHLDRTEDDTCDSVSSIQSTEGLTTELARPYVKVTTDSVVQNDAVDSTSDMYDELTYLVQNCEVTEPKNKLNGFLPYIW